MFISWGLKLVVSRSFSFLYTQGEGDSAVAAGLVIFIWGIWSWGTYFKFHKEQIVINAKIYLFYLTIYSLMQSLYLLLLFFEGRALAPIFLTPIMSLAISFLFIQGNKKKWQNQHMDFTMANDV